VSSTSGSNNGSVNVTVAENTSTSSRSTTISISGDNVSQSVTVSQEGAEVINTFTPDPTKLYHIDSPHHNLRLAATGESQDAYTTSTSATGDDVEWQFVDKGNGYWHVQRAAGGTVPRLRTDNSPNADMQGTAWSGVYTYYEFAEGAISNTYFFTLPDGPTNYKRLQIDNSGLVKMVSTASAGTWESFSITEVIENNTPSCSSGTNLALNATVVDYSAQQNTTNIVENILDENTGNRWSASGFPQYATIDLGDNYSVDEIILETYNDRDYQFTVEGSTSSATSGFSTLVDASNNTDSGPINRSFTAQTVRYVRLTITGANSYTGSWSSITDFEVICSGLAAKGIDEVQKEAIATNLNVYPNPFSSMLTIDNDGTIDSYSLIDLSGKTISSGNIDGNQTTIYNLNSLSEGIYILQLYKQGQLITNKKLVKN